jgi:hypothetical protein
MGAWFMVRRVALPTELGRLWSWVAKSNIFRLFLATDFAICTYDYIRSLTNYL